MSSRRRRQAKLAEQRRLNTEADVLLASPLPEDAKVSDGAQKARYAERRRGARARLEEQTRWQHARNATPLPLDSLDTATLEARGGPYGPLNRRLEFSQMHAAQVYDDGLHGARVLRAPFAAHLDDARKARYTAAVRDLRLHQRAQYDAFNALFYHDPAHPPITVDLEEATAQRLGLTLSLLRLRVWKAIRDLWVMCGEDMPQRLKDYREMRRLRIVEQRDAARSAYRERQHGDKIEVAPHGANPPMS